MSYSSSILPIVSHRGVFNGLGAGILEALRIKKSEKNLQDMDRLIEEDQPEEAAVTDLLGQSPIIEPDARKRRKR